MRQTEKLPLADINIELIDGKLGEIISQLSQSTPVLCNYTENNSSHSSGANKRSTTFWSVKEEPDLLIIAGPYIKLDGYPPWQIRLTEIYCTGKQGSSTTRHKAVKYQTFLKGLYQYAGAEMRFGR
ncbi:hypothetical protein VF21_09801 [Pseudogymnoascus sp. 05NY08]|nr:hypothetical protein VF21_09801 [Pseudogymnoascus sp. 05NY08]